MKEKLTKFFTALLAVTMLSLAVMKAQGCQKNEPEGESTIPPTATEPVKEPGDQKPNEPASNEVAKVAKDAGSEDGGLKQLIKNEPMRIMPASKAGHFMPLPEKKKAKEKQPSQQQQNAPQ